MKNKYNIIILCVIIILIFNINFVFVSGGRTGTKKGTLETVTQAVEKNDGTNLNIKSAIKNPDGTFKVEGSYTDKYGNNIKGKFTIDSNGNIISAEDITIDGTNIKNAKNLKITKNSIKAENIEYIKDKSGKWTVKKAEEITTETEGSEETTTLSNGDISSEDFDFEDVFGSISYNNGILDSALFKSNKDNNKAKISIKDAEATLFFNKNDIIKITSENGLKKIEMSENDLLRLNFSIATPSFGMFKALKNDSFIKELGNKKYKIHNGIFIFKNSNIEELSNCRDCSFSLDYYTGIICLYMQNSSLYNYKSIRKEDYAFYSLQNYTLCFQKTEKRITEDYTGLINLYDNYYLLFEKFMLMKRFPLIDSFIIASKTKKQKTLAKLDNENNIISSLEISAEKNKKTVADEGCFRIVENNNERFAKAKECNESILRHYKTSYFKPEITIMPDLVQRAENSTAVIAIFVFLFLLLCLLPAGRGRGAPPVFYRPA